MNSSHAAVARVTTTSSNGHSESRDGNSRMTSLKRRLQIYSARLQVLIGISSLSIAAIVFHLATRNRLSDANAPLNILDLIRPVD